QRIEEPGGIGGDAFAQLIAQAVLAGGLEGHGRARLRGAGGEVRLEAGARDREKTAALRQRELRGGPAGELTVDLHLRPGRLARELEGAARPGAQGRARRLVRLAHPGWVLGLVELDVDRRRARARERLRGARVAA